MFSILIVDDDYISRGGLRDLVDWNSMDAVIVGEAEDGAEGLEMARALCPDIILTDVVMPVMDGTKLAEQVRNELLQSKIIMISAHQDIHYIKAAIKLEAVDYILKPFDMNELKSVVMKTIEKIKRQREETLGFMGNISAVISPEITLIKEQIEHFIEIKQNDSLERSVRLLFQTIRQKNMNSTLLMITICTEIMIKAVQKLRLPESSQITYEITEAIQQFGKMYDSFKMEEFLIEKLRYLESKNTDFKKTRKVICDVEHIIRKRYKENLTIQQIAQEVHMSPSHLQALFKKVKGFTINDYITSFRIEKAQEMLKDPALKIYEVANFVGYQDTNYFTKVFKRLVGINPLEYREL